MIEITENMLDDLREHIMKTLSFKRFRHTVAVEQMVTRLCALYCPQHTNSLRAAALLHDVTKEWTPQMHTAYCQQEGSPMADSFYQAPKTMHAYTAALRIPREYPAFSDPLIVNAVRWHTTGREDMTLTEQLLYLADYIDESRDFQNCVILRRYFFGADPEHLNTYQREKLLRDTLILSFDMTVRDLLNEGIAVAEDTNRARNQLLSRRKNEA